VGGRAFRVQDWPAVEGSLALFDAVVGMAVPPNYSQVSEYGENQLESWPSRHHASRRIDTSSRRAFKKDMRKKKGLGSKEKEKRKTLDPRMFAC
jgi:hypothetical protein